MREREKFASTHLRRYLWDVSITCENFECFLWWNSLWFLCGKAFNKVEQKPLTIFSWMKSSAWVQNKYFSEVFSIFDTFHVFNALRIFCFLFSDLMQKYVNTKWLNWLSFRGGFLSEHISDAGNLMEFAFFPPAFLSIRYSHPILTWT